jgi:hypothetical protein
MPIISGTVFDASGNPVAGRIVRAYRRDTGELLAKTLTSDGITPPDPHWDNVVSLLHFDGDFTDETGRIWTVVGSPTFVDDGEHQQAKLSQTNYIHSDVLLGDEPFTLEFFSAMTSNTGSGYSQPIIQWGTSKDATDGFDIEYSLGQTHGIHYRTSYSYFPRISPSSGWSLDKDKERNHIAIVYDGLSVVCYVNGVGVPVSNFNNMGTTRRLALGWGNGSWYENRDKIIDELRITKGVARYTENFTPPTEPFPDATTLPLGKYEIETTYTGECFVICFPNEDENMNAKIWDRVVPLEI